MMLFRLLILGVFQVYMCQKTTRCTPWNCIISMQYLGEFLYTINPEAIRTSFSSHVATQSKLYVSWAFAQVGMKSVKVTVR